MIRCVDGDVESEIDTSVALTVEQVQACLHGPMLARARAVATLTTIQLERLFPGPKITAGRNLRRVGRRLKTDRVRLALAAAPARVLFAAAKYRDEASQLSAASAAYLGLTLSTGSQA